MSLYQNEKKDVPKVNNISAFITYNNNIPIPIESFRTHNPLLQKHTESRKRKVEEVSGVPILSMPIPGLIPIPFSLPAPLPIRNAPVPIPESLFSWQI